VREIKPLSAKANALLERYKSTQGLPASAQKQLLDAVNDRAQRGDLPSFDVRTDLPIAPRGGLLGRLWSSTWSRFGALVVALGLTGTGIYRGVQGEATPRGTQSLTAASASSIPVAPALRPTGESPSLTGSSLPPEASRHPDKGARHTTPPPQSTVDEEVRLLNAAQEALRAGDPASALRVLQEHEARFPNGQMADARDVMSMLALAKSGRTTQACVEARRFLDNRPQSPFGARVRTICPQADSHQ
jgi:hypothetical protein